MDMQHLETDFEIKRRFLRRPFLGLWLLAIGIMLFAAIYLSFAKWVVAQTTLGATLFASIIVGVPAMILFHVFTLLAIGHGIALVAYAEKYEHTGIGVFTIGAGLLALAYLWTAL